MIKTTRSKTEIRAHLYQYFWAEIHQALLYKDYLIGELSHDKN